MLCGMSSSAAPHDLADRALAYLIAHQERQDLTGREMALLLGMREQEWSRIRNGHRPFGPLQRERACFVFPELRDLLYEGTGS